MPTKFRSKIKSLTELAQVLVDLKRKGKKIVHCHGVFDLVHIGHIRHFREAKKMGDVLVVTLTQDQHVKKGPNRPAFKQELRLEMIASLECVDYVALNDGSLATHAIKCLKPDLYVKGSDYKDATKDVTGGIVLEREAIESVGGKLAFTDDIVFSSSGLLNKHMPVFAKEVMDYLTDFAGRFKVEDIIEKINGFEPIKVLAIGETIIDEYQYCEAVGKSSKEPMLAIKHLSTEKFAGGILAVANHLANFSKHVGVLTELGEINTQEEFIRTKLSPAVASHFVYRSDSPTIVKRRFIESYFFTKLMEIYEINDSLPKEVDTKKVCRMLEKIIPRYDLVVVVDFGHSMMTPEVIKVIADKAKFLAVNAQSNAGNLGYNSILKYPRADYVCMAENEIRLEARDRRGDLKKMILDIAKKLKCSRLTATRGKNGSLCYDRKDGFFEIPAFAGQVVDRMGAGDSFLSITSLCAYHKLPTELVGFIGNVVGAQAVATVGNREPIHKASLCKYITGLLK